MNKYFLVAFILLSFCVSAQKPVLENDTLTYNETKFYVGSKLTALYGSGNNKDFAFVYYGTGLTGVQNATAIDSKTELIVNKIYKQSGKYYIRCAQVEKPNGNKFFIDVEGAIDNKEIQSE